MAQLVRKVEDVFLNDPRQVVIAVRTSIGQNRRGGEVKENEASIQVEIIPASEREISFNALLKDWEKQVKDFKEFKEVRFARSRFGSDSGSPIAIEVQENNDSLRDQVAQELKRELQQMKGLIAVEIEEPIQKNEFSLDIIKEKVHRLGVNFSDLSTTLRTYIEGDILYTLNSGEEEVDLRLTSLESNKKDIQEILKATVSNKEGYLIPISELVRVSERKKAANIQRVNFKRAVTLYADIEKSSLSTPLEYAQILEETIFPKVLTQRPSVNLVFRGEIEDSRESQSDFGLSIALVLGIIYLLLIFLFDSFTTPLLIAAIIPFGVIGTVLAFWSHGFSQYGFFAVVGTLGMIGVVINDSIVLVKRLEEGVTGRENLFSNIAELSASRLRAIVITTVTTVAGLFPTAYGLGGYDSMLAEMMLAMGWGLLFGMFITLYLVPCLYSFYAQAKWKKEK